jgi:UDP-glucose 4-epimerase
MRILVTGAAGFIASHLCERLLAEGHKVYGIDNLSVGRLANIDHLIRHENFSFQQSDVELEEYLPECDWIFHLAARADIVPSITHPMKYHRTNVNGTLQLLELARKHDIKRFIYAASSSCYGVPENFPTPEHAAIKPMYPYALTKYVGEKYVMHWSRVYKLPAVSLRFFNVFGPRARTSGTYGAVFGVFLAQLANGKPLTVVGDGRQRRDFTYVDDAVAALIAAAESDITNQVFNVGSGQPHSVNEIVDIMKPKDVVYLPKRPGEPDCTWAEISKIKIYLNWAPKVAFHDGVERLLKHIDDFKHAPVWDKDSIAKATKEWFAFLG